MSFKNVFVSQKGEKVPAHKAAISYLLVGIVLLVAVWGCFLLAGVKLDYSFLPDVKLRLWQGFWMTVGLSAASLAVSLVIGIASAAGQDCKFLPVRYLSGIYVKFIRGTPLIMQIYLFFYIVGTAFGVQSRFVSGVVILSVFEGAYISEILRGSLLSIEGSQREAAKAVGFTKKQTAQYVILPQLVARTLPALTGQFASIIKDSSLLSMISVIELTQTMREISASNLKLFECYLLLGALYLCLTLPISYVSKRLERRYGYES